MQPRDSGISTRQLPSSSTNLVGIVRPASAPHESIPHHDDPSTAGAVSECVKQLQGMGYGKDEEGGVGRLVVYAQAVEGELGDAIDLIEEDGKAWGARNRG